MGAISQPEFLRPPLDYPSGPYGELLALGMARNPEAVAVVSRDVNLTYRERLHSELDPVSAYLRLREVNPAPYAGFLQHRVPGATGWLLSSSPERYALVTAGPECRMLETKPIKGTLPRLPDPDDDATQAERLRTDPRFRAENLMIVDLLRNDLSTVCEPGTVEVPELMAVESYATVHQLVTTVAWQIGGRTEYALEGSVFIGGAVVQWLRDGLGIIRAAADVEALALTVPDSGGVYLVPAFAGLGAPHWDPFARGAIVGLTRGTTAGHIARAALESIAFQVADLLAFNGYANQYDHDPLAVSAGDRVRIWVLDAGPDRATSFHVVGGQFSTTYAEGAYLLRDGGPGGDAGSQTLALGAAQGGFVELELDEPGHYPFVSHVMVDAERGAHGILDVR